MTPRQTRALRGAGAAWVATVVAATAHTLAGDGAPAPLLVAATAVLASPVAVLLAGQRISVWRTGMTVVLSQALFHVAFALTAGAAPGTGGHLHHAEAQLLLPPVSAAGLLPSGWMMLGHALAAIATIVALHRGERMLGALGRGIRRLLGLGRGHVSAVVRSGAPVTTGAGAESIRRPVLLSDVSRRGPPAPAIAAA